MTGFAFPEMMRDVVATHRAGEVERAADIFDAYLPLVRYEQRPGFGLAVRKHILAERGAISGPAQRRPATRLGPENFADIAFLLACQGEASRRPGMRAMNRLLYLSNGPRKRSVAALEERFERCGLALDQRWAFDGEFPDGLDGYCGVFLSGSPHGAYEDIPFIHREHALIAAAAARGLPMLGICFGSQILASALCGRDQVFRRATCEVGYKTLAMTEAAMRDPLSRAVGRELRMFVWHNDEVRADHPEMRILAASDECPNQIWRYRDLPIWGIQGHPEINRAQALQWFELSRARFESDGADVAALAAAADDTAEAKILLHEFATFCLAHQTTFVEE